MFKMDSQLDIIKDQLLSLSLLASGDSEIYVKSLQDDIEKNKQQQTKLKSESEECMKLKELLDNLSEHATKKVLYKVNPVCALPVTLIHTGEFKVKIGTDMFLLNSLKETKQHLSKKHASLSEELQLYKVNLNELERRLDFVIENKLGENELLELSNMPDQIVSNKGVAVKMKHGFEILEFEAEPIITPRQKRTKQVEKETSIDVFEVLNKLEEEEGILDYLDSNK